MTREAYHKALQELEDELLNMGEMAINAIKGSVESLKKRDIEASKEIIKNDLLINKKRFEIEERCLLLIATQQPMAVDLRTIAAILSIITDIERIADHAEGIAKINVMIGKEQLVKPLIDVPKMADKGLLMLDRCLKAFITRDADTARAICDEDNEVDSLYDHIYRELLFLMIENPKIIEGATYLIWVAHNLERIADRVTNIAERVVFMVTGRMEEINVSKY
ncbi:MAG: phosphate transport system regulatory protein PhoU [Nitrospinae bacterium RIFCSPLOWO2_02_FULL_39_110]|nr:MAG: phosphate transport system regulatory protein PhoU [Nitrospinae bacterium RIFCSPHIGHO2_02_39_11]OGW00620.1 MAG: phosphate transport system regulatory protein PhoU [Nitrospinae bacterium RIFCSPHIGHO2_12_FULL_39_42]OGW02168.1 MAG: phosphate transport system regulatory protein PhoU [Nitrospinae bacterium RIFCSPHIGHO2_02_FULL_39_82]OGW06679.1 MAG: phosphate transport system regulatory protein PhoU [Nitrospinae bacterium RIFCSPLOWO2_02_FULL_39_110]OGW07226.1 MAG: phosphate transport system r